MIGYANYVDMQRKEDGTDNPEPAPVNFVNGPGDLPLLPPEEKEVKGMEIAKNAHKYFKFDSECLPSGFKFQDPSRMEISVKALLTHLRNRQEELGVKAFKFHHVLRQNKLESAEYPEAAQKVFDGNIAVGRDDTPAVAAAKMEDKAGTEDKPKPIGTNSPTKNGGKGRKGKIKSPNKAESSSREVLDATHNNLLESPRVESTHGTPNCMTQSIAPHTIPFPLPFPMETAMPEAIQPILAVPPVPNAIPPPNPPQAGNAYTFT
jgi:hypothetical protein